MLIQFADSRILYLKNEQVITCEANLMNLPTSWFYKPITNQCQDLKISVFFDNAYMTADAFKK